MQGDFNRNQAANGKGSAGSNRDDQYVPRRVYYSLPTQKRSQIPFIRFLEDRKKCRGLLRLNNQKPGYRWGYSEESITQVFMDSTAKYIKAFESNSKSVFAFVFGAGAYSWFGMLGIGPICWLIEFIAGLIQLGLGIKFQLPVILLCHLGCWWCFNDNLLIRFFKTYKKYAEVYRPVSPEMQTRILKEIGQNPIIGFVYLGIEIGLFFVVQLTYSYIG